MHRSLWCQQRLGEQQLHFGRGPRGGRCTGRDRRESCPGCHGPTPSWPRFPSSKLKAQDRRDLNLAVLLWSRPCPGVLLTPVPHCHSPTWGSRNILAAAPATRPAGGVEAGLPSGLSQCRPSPGTSLPWPSHLPAGAGLASLVNKTLGGALARDRARHSEACAPAGLMVLGSGWRKGQGSGRGGSLYCW